LAPNIEPGIVDVPIVDGAPKEAFGPVLPNVGPAGGSDDAHVLLWAPCCPNGERPKGRDPATETPNEELAQDVVSCGVDWVCNGPEVRVAADDKLVEARPNGDGADVWTELIPNGAEIPVLAGRVLENGDG
jgi:hypothetical protein